MAPAQRTWFGALLDRWYTWSSSLPPETCSYTVERLRVPIGDNLEATADLYLPLTAEKKPKGTILIRSPYGIGLPATLGSSRFFAARGYVVLLSACRGTAGSDGELDPARNEAEDGHVTVAWMRKQPWYTGSFATIGGSYLGFTQWALLTDPPPDMKAAAIFTGPINFRDFIWRTGALEYNIIYWADFQTVMRKKAGFITVMRHIRSQKTRLKPVFDQVPLMSALEKHFGADMPPWFPDHINKPDPEEPHWTPLNASHALDRAQIPILLVAGWYDLLLPDVMEQYRKLTQRGITVDLVIGPWTHLGAQRRNVSEQGLYWFENHLVGGGRPDVDDKAPVRIYVTGANEWRDLPKWPPLTSPQELFLNPGKKLMTDRPPADVQASTFDFDPTSPTPALGGPELFGTVPTNEFTGLVDRSDVLTFTTEALDHDVEICGKPVVELYHSSDNPYVDLLVYLGEVDAKGAHHSISEKYIRLDDRDRDRDSSGPVQLALNDCAHRFNKGTKICVLIAGGAHPRYIRNLGTGENQVTGSVVKPARHTVRHEAAAASKLVLPITAVAIGE